MIHTVTIYGSHGELLVHHVSGHIIARTGCGCEDCQQHGGYGEIAWIDPATLPTDYAQADILTVGMVYRDGTFEPPTVLVTMDTDGGEIGWRETPALLAKPDVEVCLHGFVSDDEGDHYSDREDEITGWCVYLRRNQDKSVHLPFFERDWDIDGEWDFPSYEEAHAKANQLAADYGTTIFEY